MENFIEKMNWRYAVKQFDKTKKLTEEQVNTLLESLRLSASSFGLQPWKFVVVTNDELKATLREKSWNQAQISDCSHLIVLCSFDEMTDEKVDMFLEDTAKTRGQDMSELEGYGKMMKGFLSHKDGAAKDAWMRNQVYIALGNLLTTCAVLDIDACPVEGFSAPDYDEILGLKAKGLKSVVVCPVGHRSNEDKYASAPKVRYPLDSLVERYE